MRIKYVFAMLILLGLSQNTKANELSHPFAADGQFWLEICTHKIAEFRELVCPAFIFGLRGAYEASVSLHKIPERNQAYCPPDNLTLSESVYVFVNYLEQNPEDRVWTARTSFILAMKEQFPCQ